MKERERIPGFQIVTRIGAGGMGEVFHAVRIGPGGFRKPVALKRLALDHALDRKAIERFLREARISAHLDHPNLVGIHDLLEIDRRYFIVMELLRGANLDELGRILRERGAVPWGIAFAAAEQALAGLAYAHAARGDDGTALGLVHRDLTPRNVFVCDSGTVKILDFGIAKLRGAQALGLTPGLTQDGRLPGTLEFMAPEQVRGDAIDVRTDLYQLGGTLYHVLTGRAPHGIGTPAEVLQRVGAGEVVPIAAIRPDLPAAAAAVIMRALAPAPADRFVDADQMRDAVRALVRELPDGAPALSGVIASLHRDRPDPAHGEPSSEGADSASRATQSRGTTRHDDDPRQDRALPATIAAIAIAAVVLVATGIAAGRLVDRPVRRARPACPPGYLVYEPGTGSIDVVDLDGHARTAADRDVSLFVFEILQLVIAPSVDGYAHTYLRRQGTLYLVTGLE